MEPDQRLQAGDLPSICVRRPILAIVLNLLIVIAGVAALLGVDVRELPNVERPTITITASYSGASPETMDAEVTRPLEGAAARVPGVRSISSSSEEGSTRVRVSFDSSIDINDAANDAREAVSDVRRRLPDGVENVFVVKADDESDPIMRLSVWSGSLSREALTERIEDEIVPELLSVPGVADVRIYGTRERTLNVVVDPQRLASYRLSIGDVADALENAQLDVPAGSLETAEQNLIVRADASVVEETEVEDIVIQGTTRIGDVASVFYGPAEATSWVRLDGREVLNLGIIRQPQSNTVEISSGIDKVVATLDRRLRDVSIVKTSDDAIFIRGSIREVLLTLVFGTAIVVAVIMLFIGSPTLTLIPAVTIPVALMGTVGAIWLLGFSINILTLLALVLATGIIVDDAIVVLENIVRTRQMGMGRLAAAVLGTRQVFFAVIATTATLASVFVPIAFLPGRAGQLFTEFGFVLAIAVALSSFVALSLCPMLASRLIPGAGEEPRPGRLWTALTAAGRSMTRAYARVLRAALAAPVLVAGIGLAAAAGVGTLYTSLDQELVPEEDRGLILVSLSGPDGVTLDYTDRQVKQVEALLQPFVESGEITGVLSITGRWDPNRGFIIAPLAPWGERRGQAEIAGLLEPGLERIPGARASIYGPNSLSIRSGGSELEFAITGPTYPRIAEAGDLMIEAISERLPQLSAPRLSYSTTQPQLTVRIDRERAADLGVDIAGVAETLRAMVEGSEVAELNVGDETVPIRIESRSGAIDDTDDLRNLYVAAADGRVVPMSSFIEIAESGVAAELEREGQRRAVEVEAGLGAEYPLSQAVEDVEALAAEVLPVGTSILLTGEAEALEEAAREVLITFSIALVVVLLVLAAQFESFPSAVVVMTTVPFGLAAAVLALWLTGSSLNIYSQIGLVMLIGLMAKNGILIVEFANQLRDSGMSVAEAAEQAAIVRLRPVVMTMLSTTLAGLPLILSTGPGAEGRHAIGWVIFGGLGIALFATLLVTPVIYRLLAPLARSRADFGRALAGELEQARTGHGRGAPEGVPGGSD
ncbi:MAG TPA: efflux RND transporter permease subunit [Geminicoccaceae bacterium]